jgi:hypothetical protein
MEVLNVSLFKPNEIGELFKNLERSKNWKKKALKTIFHTEMAHQRSQIINKGLKAIA